MDIIVKNNTKYSKKNVIISVPKRYIKKAHQRNKIKRQIRVILRDSLVKNNKNLFIQYVCSDMPVFLELKSILDEKLNKLV